ncbi:MAG TPA: flagellar assembly protein FliW [Dissulfurispiraceae bacterium]
MKLNTTRFGEIEIEESKIIEFPLGIPGFAVLKRYILIEYKEPIRWLHAVDEPDVAFIVTDPFAIFPEYTFDMSDEVKDFLGLKDPKDIVVLVIVTVADNSLTVNLKAPIIFNAANFKAAQMIIDSDKYSFKEPFPVPPPKGEGK